MPTPQPFSACCLKSFKWDGTPTGHESTLSNNSTYITGSNPHAAVLYIHDALGWTFSNARLLADHFAKEANVTVYMPDFFGGEALDAEKLKQGRWAELDMVGFRKRNDRDVREKEIFDCARELRGKYDRLGAVGYCYGGWGVLRLAAAEHNPPLVDCIICAHPSWITAEDFDTYGRVPVQFLAPETDFNFSPELKMHAFQKLVLERKGIGKDGNGFAVDWVHLPGVAHGCLTKGDENVEGEREAMVRGKDAAVGWFRQWLS
jgi:dienelactone hydrolase